MKWDHHKRSNRGPGSCKAVSRTGISSRVLSLLIRDDVPLLNEHYSYWGPYFPNLYNSGGGSNVITAKSYTWSTNTFTKHPCTWRGSWMEWEDTSGILSAQIKSQQAEERWDGESTERRKGAVGRGMEGWRSLAVICGYSAASRCVAPTGPWWISGCAKHLCKSAVDTHSHHFCAKTQRREQAQLYIKHKLHQSLPPPASLCVTFIVAKSLNTWHLQSSNSHKWPTLKCIQCMLMSVRFTFTFLFSSFFQDGLKTADKLKQYIEKLAADLYNVNTLSYFVLFRLVYVCQSKLLHTWLLFSYRITSIKLSNILNLRSTY